MKSALKAVSESPAGAVNPNKKNSDNKKYDFPIREETHVNNPPSEDGGFIVTASHGPT